MKLNFLALTLGTLLSLTPHVYAASCNTYGHGLSGTEISGSSVDRAGRAIKNRSNGDQIYLSCMENNSEGCIHANLVLEAVSCASKESPRYFNLTPDHNFVVRPSDEIANEMNRYLLKEMDFPEAYDFFKATAWTFMLGGFAHPAFYVLLPASLTVDVMLSPNLLVEAGAKSAVKAVVASKSKNMGEVDEITAKKRAKKMSNENFFELLHIISYEFSK